MKRPMNLKGEEIEIHFPNKKYIEKADTEGYLVLIATNKSNVIMPEYMKYVKNKMMEICEIKGKPKYHNNEN